MTTIQELYNINKEQLVNIATIEAMAEIKGKDIRQIFKNIQAIEDKTTREICIMLFAIKRFNIKT
jgi:hypothetical protein